MFLDARGIRQKIGEPLGSGVGSAVFCSRNDPQNRVVKLMLPQRVNKYSAKVIKKLLSAQLHDGQLQKEKNTPSELIRNGLALGPYLLHHVIRTVFSSQADAPVCRIREVYIGLLD